MVELLLDHLSPMKMVNTKEHSIDMTMQTNLARWDFKRPSKRLEVEVVAVGKINDILFTKVFQEVYSLRYDGTCNGYYN